MACVPALSLGAACVLAAALGAQEPALGGGEPEASGPGPADSLPAGVSPAPGADVAPGAPGLETPVDSVLLGRGLSREARAALEAHLRSDPLVLEGDVEVPRDSAFERSLLVVGGTLRFAGRTPGGLAVAGGDLFLRPGAEVGGDVIVVGGGYYGSGLATMAGEARVIRGERVRTVRQPGRVEIAAEPEERPFPVALRGLYGFRPEMYNRVDGLAVSWGVRYVAPRAKRDALRLSAAALLRSSRSDLGWSAVAERELTSRRLRLRASFYDRTDTAERWHRGDVETSLATFFLGEDNRFYFDRRGIELRVEQEIRGPLALDGAFRNDTYRSVRVQDPFTLASDDFLPNPPVPEGTMRSFLAGATWDGRDDPDDPRSGWWARLEGEAAGGALEGDFGFTSGRLDLRRYQPLGSHRLDARVLLGGRIGGSLPEQKRYNLGGAATLPGYEALSVRGDRAALLNLRYRVPLPALRRLGIFRQGAWITFLGGVGDAWESRTEDPRWLASGGVGLAGTGVLREVGLYLVVPSERVSRDQGEVSLFLYFGSFF